MEEGMEMVGESSSKNQSSKAPEQSPLQEAVAQKGMKIFQDMEAAASEGASIFNKDWWYGRIMDWSMRNDHFKTQMFRFVDVLPYLNSSAEVARHLKEYFAEKGENGDQMPSIFNFGLGVGSLAPGLLAGAVKKNVTQMAKMFITGETPEEALPVLKKARKNNLCFTVDLLGEATLSEQEAQDYQRRYLELIDRLAQDSLSWEENPLTDTDERGPIPKVNISVKVSSLYSQIHLEAWEETLSEMKDRLRPIFRRAMEKSVFINIDMEHYALKNLTLQLFSELILEEEFKDYPHWGLVIQAYLRDSLRDVEQMVKLAQTRGTPFTIRLVKGAYWDYEVIEAEQKGWPIPVYTQKQESDANFEACARLMIDNHPHIRLALGSHNVRSLAAALVWAEKRGLDPRAIEIQMLFGMADPIKKAMVRQGYRVREYATVGELIPGMAYLVRRLLENTSNESFLRSKFAENISPEQLLEDPQKGLAPSSPLTGRARALAQGEGSPEKPGAFYNEPPLDFTVQAIRQQMKDALEKVEKSLGQTYPLVIGKKEVKTAEYQARMNPSRQDQVVGQIPMASTTQAEEAVQAAKEAFVSWSQTSVEKRAEVLDRLADLIVARRFELCAWEILEVGKTWAEADGDIIEAADFCRYYARDMRQKALAQRMGRVPGELSLLEYVPRGVTAVIAPWNFPLAILTGMTVAAVVTGNTVVMKPAEQSSITAYQLMKLLQEAGLPPGVVNYLPGQGEVVGDYLTSHKEVALVAFTGSRGVGLEIVKKMGLIQSGQRQVKGCVVEMGGKNALIIDSDADLDEAVAAALYSAFGFQGQKCSALSRAIVLESIYDRFMERLVEGAASLHVRPAMDPGASLGPVVDQEAQNKILGMIERAKSSQARLAFQGQCPSGGYFIPPTIFADVDPQSELGQEEVFGPVLAVMKVKNLDEALKVANDTDYALTGGLYSRSPAHIERVKRELFVGNLYINREITGAIVDRHPFGGFKMSGLGSKTGGPDYLLHYMYPRTITENTLRRGFAPKIEGDSGGPV